MREILFCGKRLDNGEWVEGSLVHRTKYYGDPDDRYFILTGGEFDCDCYDAYEVDPATVGQFTGLMDKNGKRIFEGDVVTFTRINALGYTTRRCGDVRYYDKLPIFYIMANTGDAWDWCDCNEIEVIGNIHDNPEPPGEEGE